MDCAKLSGRLDHSERLARISMISIISCAERGSSTMATPNIFNRPISFHSLPPELLSNLSVRSIQAQTTVTPPPPEPKSAATPLSASSLSCQTCPGAAFDTVEDQRGHFKSDWHRYNVKAKLTGRSVTEEEWGNLVEGELEQTSAIGARSLRPQTEVAGYSAMLMYVQVFHPSPVQHLPPHPAPQMVKLPSS